MQASMLYPVYVKSITHEAEQVLAFDLRPVSGIELPPFTAGAHIDVVIEGMPTRSYSLLNHPDDKNRYVIAVARDPASRGGSGRTTPARPTPAGTPTTAPVCPGG